MLTAAEDREHDAFDGELADQSALRCAERGPEGELAAAAQARAMVRLATLAQAMSNTSAIAPATSASTLRDEPTTCSISGTTLAVHPVSNAGTRYQAAAATVFISAWACAGVTPSLSRASTIP